MIVWFMCFVGMIVRVWLVIRLSGWRCLVVGSGRYLKWHNIFSPDITAESSRSTARTFYVLVVMISMMNHYQMSL